ncbi:aminoglycoside phosphotransferase family protein [Paenibacillus sp.]|uniref:aminoglycoside phosphotransferase family protein n=1 Tax=Paenibacillus sp. TaxID=58172 RepID=UPI002D74720C|nr:aminoglycoside phosphotransferase family protein [Paenibacillus sp.]HZG87648.1 aminoglycoside phosphotransferase family protein [Paenibacillus sp.]
MPTIEEAAETARERFRSMDFRVRELRNRTGPFAATLFDVWASRPNEPEARYVYKLPPEDRRGEFELLAELGDELKPWLPDVLGRFDDPRAIVMRYAGEPLLPPEAPERAPLAERRAAYGIVAERLAELHARTAPAVDGWAREGRVPSYAYSREWADEMLEAAGGLLDGGTVRRLAALADDFYAGYSESRMRGPRAFTHGDTHWGNALWLDGRLTLIDWEWCRASTPMRDIAILVQDEPDDDVLSHVAEEHAERLLRAGVGDAKADLMYDFAVMMIDNSFMTLGWDAALRRRGDVTERRFQEVAARRIARIASFWKQIEG